MQAGLSSEAPGKKVTITNWLRLAENIQNFSVRLQPKDTSGPVPPLQLRSNKQLGTALDTRFSALK
jgi:hypothetical protein